MGFTPATNGFRPASNYATPDETGDNHPCLDFDGTTNETVYYHLALPGGYGGGGMTYTFLLAMSSATSGNVQLDIAIERMNTDLAASGGFGSDTTGSVSVSGSAGVPFELSIAVANADLDGTPAGGFYRLRVVRNNAVASNAAGDLELLSFTDRET